MGPTEKQASESSAFFPVTLEMIYAVGDLHKEQVGEQTSGSFLFV